MSVEEPPLETVAGFAVRFTTGAGFEGGGGGGDVLDPKVTLTDRCVLFDRCPST